MFWLFEIIGELAIHRNLASHGFWSYFFTTSLILAGVSLVAGTIAGLIPGFVFYKFNHNKSLYARICFLFFAGMVIGVLAVFVAFSWESFHFEKYNLAHPPMDSDGLVYAIFLTYCICPGFLFFIGCYFFSMYMFGIFQKTALNHQSLLENDVTNPSS